MSVHPFHRRLPRAGIDPLVSLDHVLPLVRTLVSVPAAFETFVIVVDDAQRGLGIAHITNTTEPDDVVGIVERFAVPDLAHGIGAGIIVVSVRPGDDIAMGDIDRWLEMSDLTDDAGIELVEWLIVGRTIVCPRDLLGVPPRWGGNDARSI